MQSNEKNGRDFYALAWRWHFYAGLFVAPFMILLALTGIVYLFKPQLDALLYPQLLRVEAGAQMRSADQLLAGVRQAHPQAAVDGVAHAWTSRGVSSPPRRTNSACPMGSKRTRSPARSRL